MSFIVIFCTAGSDENARLIAHTLIEEKLAACVNILPGVNSVYRWEGKVVEEGELLLIIKTRGELFGQVEKRIKELHTYDVPEVIALEIKEGSADYLDWLAKNSGS